jgi:hypothetical protein
MSDVSDRDVVEQRFDAPMRLAEHMSEVEAAAAGVDQPVALGLLRTGASVREVELRGGVEGVIEIPTSGAHERLGFDWNMLGFERLPRTSREWVASSSVANRGRGEPPPAAWAIVRLSDATKRFNADRPKVVILVAEAPLAERLERALTVREADAALVRELAGAPLLESPGRDLHLVMPSGPAGALWGRWGPEGYAVWTATAVAAAAAPRAVLHVRDDIDPTKYRDIHEIGPDLGLTVPVDAVWSGSLDHIVSRLLGYDADDVEVQRPGWPAADRETRLHEE